MRLSLRNKLILLLATMLLLTAAPLIGLTLQRSSEVMESAYQKGIQDILGMAELAIRNNFSERINLKAMEVESRKAALRISSEATVIVMHKLLHTTHSSSEINEVLSSLEASVGGDFYLLCDNEKLFNGTNGVPTTQDLSLTALFALHDTKGRTLNDILQIAKEDGTGEFAVVQLKTTYGESPHLLYAMPIQDSTHFLISLLSFDAVDMLMSHNMSQLRNSLRTAFNNLEFLEDGFVTAYNTRTNALEAATGQGFNNIDISMLRTSLRDAVHGNDAVLTVNDYMVFTHELRQFHLLLVAGVPVDSINHLMNSLAKRQLFIFTVILCFGLILALLFAKNLLAPLERLTCFVKILPEHDFTKPQDSLASVLPLQRKDEIGELARAFSGMGDLLHHNISSLLLVTSAKERLEGELGAARAIQDGILPEPLPYKEGSGFKLDADLVPAREVGGDLYDYFMVDTDTLCVCVGDVSGKGTPAAFLMGVTTSLVRAIVQPGISPEKAMETINEQLCAHNPESMFVTLFIGLYSIKTGKLRFASAGHPAPVLFGRHAVRSYVVPCPDLVAGLMSGITYTCHSLRLETEEALLLYTDGITEAMDSQGALYGRERMEHLCAGMKKDPVACVPALFADVNCFACNTEQADDMTVLVLQRVQALSEKTEASCSHI